jgi:L-threonylcarbamoyladenylate synthase
MKQLVIDPENPGMEALAEAAALITLGKVVAYPTDTAYGLGARISNKAACEEIYRIKGRAMDQPLILLGDDTEQFLPYCRWTDEASRLAARFWPGALTLILQATEKLPGWVNAYKGTVGGRIPDHAVPRGIARALGEPMATTSANHSGQASPRTGLDVEAQLSGTSLALLLDGGSTHMGADSTILDLSDGVKILRAGGLKPEDILRWANER